MSTYIVGPCSFGITCLISGVDTYTDELTLFDLTRMIKYGIILGDNLSNGKISFLFIQANYWVELVPNLCIRVEV